MSNQILLTTTGTLSPVTVSALGGASFIHPTVALPLIEPSGDFTFNDVNSDAAVELQAFVAAGHITLTDGNGNSITDITDPDQTGFVSLIGDEDIDGIKRFQKNIVINDKGFTSVATPPYTVSIQDDDFAYIELLIANGPAGGADKGSFVCHENNGPTLNDQQFAFYNFSGGPIIFYTDTIVSSFIERFRIEPNGTLNVAGTTNYELLVTADDDVPNKKYVDDEITAATPAASETVAGLAEIATQAEVDTGTDTTRYVTPATLANTAAVVGGGILGLGEWTYDNATGVPPADKEFRFNNATPASATLFRIDYTNENGNDLTNFIQNIAIGALVYAQQKEDSTNGFLFEVTSNTDQGTYAEIGITNFELLGAALSNGDKYVVLSTFSALGVPKVPLAKHTFPMDTLDSPNTADWAVNAFAALGADSNNNALRVRQFDDTTEEGIGFTLEVPDGTTNVTFKFRSRAETAPGAAQTVSLVLYERELPDNGAITAWSAGTDFTDLSMPTNENWQYDEQTFTIATAGLTAGSTHQFEITRDGAGTLVGDWTLTLFIVEFS